MVGIHDQTYGLSARNVHAAGQELHRLLDRPAICVGQRGDAVVLGGTEIPLIMNDANFPWPTPDSTQLLARAALWRAVGAIRRTA